MMDVPNINICSCSKLISSEVLNEKADCQDGKFNCVVNIWSFSMNSLS
jgi:hypothetical protein